MSEPTKEELLAGETSCAVGEVSGGRSRSTIAIGNVFNQPNLKESTSGLVITGSRGDSPYREVVSHLGKSGCGWGSRNYENLLFIINLFQLDELALCMQHTLAGISNTPFERGNEMKKIFTVVMAVAFAFSVAGFAVAAEKAAAPAAAPAAEKSAAVGGEVGRSAEKSATAGEEVGEEGEGPGGHRHDRGARRGGRHLHGEGEEGERGPEGRREGEAGFLQGRRQGRREVCRWHRFVREGREGEEGRREDRDEDRDEDRRRRRDEARSRRPPLRRRRSNPFFREAVRPHKGFPRTHGQGDTIPLPFFLTSY